MAMSELLLGIQLDAVNPALSRRTQRVEEVDDKALVREDQSLRGGHCSDAMRPSTSSPCMFK